MINTHNGLQNSETQPAPERKGFEADVKRFRGEVVTALRDGQTLSLPLFSANGDDLLTRAACYDVLTQLCIEENIDPKNIRLTAVRNEDDPGLHERTLGIYSKGTAEAKLDRNFVKTATVYQESLYEFSSALGVTIDPSLYEQAPKIWPTDKGPLKDVDDTVIEETAKEIRERVGNRKIVVIGQAGSTAEKRFNDKQIVEVAAAIRQKQPDAYIIVLSDKHFLRGDIPKLQALNRAAPFPVKSVGGSKFSDEQIAIFTQELAAHEYPQQGNEIDEVVEATNTNQLLAFFRVADEAVMTDGYWMHLAASQDIPELTSLFTVFQPEKWAPPTSKVVRSAAIENETREFISSQWYHSNNGYPEQKDPNTYGIEETDIQRLIEKI